jgi:hypothetical protein
VLLDASFQVLAAALGEIDRQETFLPVAIKRVKRYPTSSSSLWSRVEINANREECPQTLTGEVHLFSDEGQLIATVEGLTVKRVTAQALARYKIGFTKSNGVKKFSLVSRAGGIIY